MLARWPNGFLGVDFKARGATLYDHGKKKVKYEVATYASTLVEILGYVTNPTSGDTLGSVTRVPVPNRKKQRIKTSISMVGHMYPIESPVLSPYPYARFLVSVRDT